MTLSLEQLSARMRQGEDIPLSDTARIALALSIPSILEQLVVTAMEYIDAAMVGHIGAEATAAIGIVSSSTWLLHGILVGLYTAFSIQIAQYLGADRQQDARGVLRQSMLFNLILGLGAAAVHALQPHPGSGRCGFRRRHQPFPARVAGGGHLASGQFQRLLRHLVGGPPLHDGHGDV